MNKPPLGLTPKRHSKEYQSRYEEVGKAIYNYLENPTHKDVPIEWVEEYNYLGKIVGDSDTEVEDPLVGTTYFHEKAQGKLDTCIVHGCTNKKSHGGFVGDICVPCHDMLITGNWSLPSNNFIQELYNKYQKVLASAYGRMSK